jgi:hypothetical protein
MSANVVRKGGRLAPIPVYAEMPSVKPIFALVDALADHGADDNSLDCKGIPALFVTTGAEFLTGHDIHDEVFGPASVIVRVHSIDRLEAILDTSKGSRAIERFLRLVAYQTSPRNSSHYTSPDSSTAPKHQTRCPTIHLSQFPGRIANRKRTLDAKSSHQPIVRSIKLRSEGDQRTPLGSSCDKRGGFSGVRHRRGFRFLGQSTGAPRCESFASAALYSISSKLLSLTLLSTTASRASTVLLRPRRYPDYDVVKVTPEAGQPSPNTLGVTA